MIVKEAPTGQIKSGAVSNKDKIMLNAALNVLAAPEYHRKGMSKEVRRKNAIHVMKRIAAKQSQNLKQALGLIDLNTSEQRTYPEKKYEDSYTKAPQTTSTAKNITLPDPSKYESYSQCVDDLTTNYSVDKNISAEFCKQVNPDADMSRPFKTNDNTSDSGDSYVGKSKSAQFDHTSCVSYLSKQGIANAETVCKGLEDNVTKGAVKSGSISNTIPSWLVLGSDDISQLEKTFNESNLRSAKAENTEIAEMMSAISGYDIPTTPKQSSIRSASVEDQEYLATIYSDEFRNSYDIQAQRERQQQMTEKRLLSASKRKEESPPSWAVISGAA